MLEAWPGFGVRRSCRLLRRRRFEDEIRGGVAGVAVPDFLAVAEESAPAAITDTARPRKHFLVAIHNGQHMAGRPPPPPQPAPGRAVPPPRSPAAPPPYAKRPAHRRRPACQIDCTALAEIDLSAPGSSGSAMVTRILSHRSSQNCARTSAGVPMRAIELVGGGGDAVPKKSKAQTSRVSGNCARTAATSAERCGWENQEPRAVRASQTAAWPQCRAVA